MDTIEIVKKNECCGCGSCVQKCPKQAISMVEDEEGFLYPQINNERCINCGLCSKVCPQLKKNKEIDNEYHIVDVKSAKVDGKNIKEDTFYTLKDGKFVEVG